MSKEMSKNSIQLTDSAYYVLLALQNPTHGYAIMQEIENFSDGLMKLGPATLYTVLSRLQTDGLIRQSELDKSADSRRKPYIITNKGKKVLNSEVKRRYKMAMHGIKKLGLGFSGEDNG